MTFVKWMRRGGAQIAHAFRARAVEAFDVVVAIGQCDSFRVAHLVEDNAAPRCATCERAVREQP